MRLVRFSCDYKLNIKLTVIKKVLYSSKENYMHQDIENIIDKKHKELFKIDFNLDYNTKLNLQRAILDSLADEVLKVVKNEMHEELNKYLCENLDLNNFGNEELRNDILQLLSNLSTNKENKNNERNV